MSGPIDAKLEPTIIQGQADHTEYLIDAGCDGSSLTRSLGLQMSNARPIQGQRPRRSINSPGGSVATVSSPATCAMKTWRPAAWQ
jgi:hypothetical protein